MSNNGIKLWRECVTSYFKDKGEPYHIPKKNTSDYIAIKKMYDAKKSNKDPEKKAKKYCKCRCKCDCPK